MKKLVLAISLLIFNTNYNLVLRAEPKIERSLDAATSSKENPCANAGCTGAGCATNGKVCCGFRCSTIGANCYGEGCSTKPLSHNQTVECFGKDCQAGSSTGEYGMGVANKSNNSLDEVKDQNKDIVFTKDQCLENKACKTDPNIFRQPSTSSKQSVNLTCKGAATGAGSDANGKACCGYNCSTIGAYCVGDNCVTSGTDANGEPANCYGQSCSPATGGKKYSIPPYILNENKDIPFTADKCLKDNACLTTRGGEVVPNNN